MKTGIGVAFAGLVTFPTAGLAWVLMWLSDRLYEGGWWWLAAPIRIITFLMQIGFLLEIAGISFGIVGIMASMLFNAARGQNEDEGKLSVKGYMGILLVPVVMALASAVYVLFANWLAFNDHGLGLIYLGFGIIDKVLEYGSMVVLVAWLVILPIFLRNRNAARA